jgi:opacity protein-like surface antigen
LYVGVGGGYAIEDFDGGNADNGGYANARVGFRFLDFLAIEGMGEWMPHFNGESGRYLSADTSIWSGWLNAKLYPTARMTGFVQPYLLAGAGGMWGDTKGGFPTNNVNDNGFAGRFGAGIDFFLTEHVFLTTDAAYLLPTAGAKALDQVVVGGALQYRF